MELAHLIEPNHSKIWAIVLNILNYKEFKNILRDIGKHEKGMIFLLCY